MGGVGGRRKEGRGRGGAAVVVVVAETEIKVESGFVECESGAKRGKGFDLLAVRFEFPSLWPGDGRESGSWSRSSPGVARRRRLGEDGVDSVFCAPLPSL